MTPPEIESKDVLAELKEKIRELNQHDLYKKKLEEADLEPGDIDSFEDFRRIPFMTYEELIKNIVENAPFGEAVPNGKSVVRCYFTPSPHAEGMVPIGYTKNDLKIQKQLTAELFRNAGITSSDVVVNTGSFTPFLFGWIVADAVEEIGASHLPLGPGKTEEKLRIIKELDATVLVGFPSFGMKLAKEADEPLEIDVLIAGGEPLTPVEGYREEIKEAFAGDLTIIDFYGGTEFGIIASDCAEEVGLHVLNEWVFPEIIDPETGEPVGMGEKGELVLTSLEKEAMPILRLRTGDLTILSEEECSCGRRYSFPNGIFGRTDEMHKVKGVKIFPSEIAMYLEGIPSADRENFRLRVHRPTGKTDRAELTIRSDPDQIDKSKVKTDLESILSIRIDELKIDPEIETGVEVIDERE